MRKLHIVFLVALGLIQVSMLPTKRSIECTLTTDKKEYKAGEVPKFEVRIKNTGKKRILLIGCLDGSAVKLRQPYCGFSIQKPVPDSLPPNFCKTVNLLTEKDFIVLSRGDSFNPFAAATDHAVLQKETFRNPGIYTIKFMYSSLETDIQKYFGSLTDKQPDAAVQQQFKRLTHISFESNTAEIIIR